MLLDASYVTPLAVGFPLNMDVVGTSAVKLNMAGFINATAFTANGELDVEGKLKPRYQQSNVFYIMCYFIFYCQGIANCGCKDVTIENIH